MSIMLPQSEAQVTTPRRKHSNVRRRKAQIALRLYDGEKAAVLACAEARGVTVGEVVRSALRQSGVFF